MLEQKNNPTKRIVNRSTIDLLLTIAPFSWYQNITNRIYTRRITKQNDKDLAGLLQLYERLMPMDYCSPREDVVRWLSEYTGKKQDAQHTFIDYWFVGKLKKQVISFLNFQYFPDSQLAFISYLGVDKQAIQGRKIAYQTVLTALQRRLQRELRQCKGIVYETDAPSIEGAQKKERRKKARNTLFKMYARQAGFKAYEICIDYVSPEVAIDPGAEVEEGSFTLSYIPLKQMPKDNTLAKPELLEILRFIYLQVYGDSYVYDHSEDPIYKKYLISLLNRYEQSLPDTIQLK